MAAAGGRDDRRHAAGTPSRPAALHRRPPVIAAVPGTATERRRQRQPDRGRRRHDNGGRARFPVDDDQAQTGAAVAVVRPVPDGRDGQAEVAVRVARPAQTVRPPEERAGRRRRGRRATTPAAAAAAVAANVGHRGRGHRTGRESDGGRRRSARAAGTAETRHVTQVSTSLYMGQLVSGFFQTVISIDK